MVSDLYINKRLHRVAWLFLTIIVLTSCGTRKSSVSGYGSATIENDLLAYSKKFIGKPYKYAGKGPNSFDCSGFTSYVFKNFGYKLNSSSAGQDRQVPTVKRKEDLRKGDLVFFEGRNKNGNVGHVGIVTEVLASGRFKFIHASTTQGVIISSSYEPYYASRYLRGGRVLEENASYVTRKNPLIENQQKSLSPIKQLSGNNSLYQPAVNVSTTKGSRTVAGDEENKVVVLVQADPFKTPPLREVSDNHTKSPQNKGDENTNGSVNKNNSDVVLRGSSAGVPAPPVSHIVQMGETLFSISNRYGCTVDQLKDWNPQLSNVLKTGDKLLVYSGNNE